MVQPSQSRLEQKPSWRGRHITSGFWQVACSEALGLEQQYAGQCCYGIARSGGLAAGGAAAGWQQTRCGGNGKAGTRQLAKLKQLTLQFNKLTVDSIAVLVSGQWPLRQLDLGQKYVDDDGMAVTQLSRATWPHLETLVLAGNMLSAKTIEPLCQAN